VTPLKWVIAFIATLSIIIAFNACKITYISFLNICFVVCLIERINTLSVKTADAGERFETQNSYSIVALLALCQKLANKPQYKATHYFSNEKIIKKH
jgi:hypothetical protein